MHDPYYDKEALQTCVLKYYWASIEKASLAIYAVIFQSDVQTWYKLFSKWFIFLNRMSSVHFYLD